jgi:hypothetical protein
MRRVAVLWPIAAAIASGCASSGTGSTAGTSIETTRVATPVGTTTLTSVSSLQPGFVTLRYPMDVVWRALPIAYDSIGIPIGKMDTLTRVVGNEGFKLRRKLGGVSLTRYLDCGQAQGFRSAETYEINLAVITQLQPADAGFTTAATTVQASAKPVNFAGEYAPCSSSGELEKRVGEVLARIVDR